jgi:hypothetical protein
MALDPRLILSGVQAGIQNAQPVTNLLTGVQQQQQLAGEDQRQRLLEQQAGQQAATAEQQALLAPLHRQAMEQKLALGQAELDLLGVPDEPTAKQLAFNAAKLSALPTPEAKIAEIGRLKEAAKGAGRTTQNLDELEAAYARSPEEGDQLLGAGIQAFERSGLLTPAEKSQAVSAGQVSTQDEKALLETKTDRAAKVLNLNPEEQQAFSVLDPKTQDKLIEESLSPKAKREAKEEVKRTEKGLKVRKQAISVLENILSSENRGALRDVVGTIDGRFDFRLQGDEADMVSQIKELGDTLTADNLDLMSGVLSESDIMLLKNLSAGGLNRAVQEDTFISRATELLRGLRGENTESVAPTADTITLPNGVPVKRISTGVNG